MKTRIYALMVSLLCGTSVFGQQTFQYPDLKPGKKLADLDTMVDTLLVTPEKYDSLRYYYFYQLISEYYKQGTVDEKFVLAKAPWDNSEEKFNMPEAKITARNYTDSLKAEFSLSSPVLRLTSRFPAKQHNPTGNTTSVITEDALVFIPENQNMRGLITPPIPWLGGGRARLTYNFSIDKNDYEESISITRIVSCCDTVSVNPLSNQKEVTQSIGLLLHTDSISQIDALSVDVEIIPSTDHYTVEKIDRQSVGKTITICGTPVTVIAFENGTAHLFFDSPMSFHQLSSQKQVKLFFGKDDRVYEFPEMAMIPMGYDSYNFYRSQCGLSYEQFITAADSLFSTPPTSEALVLYVSPNTEGEFDALYIAVDETPVLGYRNFLMLKSQNYDPTYFLKDKDGVHSGVLFESGSDISQPEFPGGRLALSLFFEKNSSINTPCTILTEATITKKGRVKNPRIFLTPRCSEENLPDGISIEDIKKEALRLVKKTDKMWSPATKNDKPFEDTIVIPVSWPNE